MATIVYVAPMLTILKTTDFDKWLAGLRSAKDRARILDRIVRVEGGNFGDHASVGEGVSELRFFFGPGYRIYYLLDGDTVVILFCGGDKGAQSRDISKSKALARQGKE